MTRTGFSTIDFQVEECTLLAAPFWPDGIIDFVLTVFRRCFIDAINWRFNDHQKVIATRACTFYLHRFKNNMAVRFIDLGQPRQRADGLRAENGGAGVTVSPVILQDTSLHK